MEFAFVPKISMGNIVTKQVVQRTAIIMVNVQRKVNVYVTQDLKASCVRNLHASKNVVM